MTGDLTAATDLQGRRGIEEVVLRRLMRLADSLVEMGVKFVGCQKTIHPLVKDYFREKVLDLSRESFVCIPMVSCVYVCSLQCL